MRAGFNRINISFIPNTLVDTNALGINVGQTDDADRAAADHDLRSGPELRRSVRLPERPRGDDVRRRRYGDLPARQSHREVRRRSPPREALQLQRRPGPFTYPSVAAFEQGFGNAFATTLGTQAFNAYVNAIGAFVQDGISVGSNLKLDLGLRYDYMPSPTEQDNKLVPSIRRRVARCRSADRAASRR